jgi:hypothetical protein
MKNTFTSKLQSTLLIGVLATGVLASASHAVAQGTAVKVTVPFAFQNGAQHLPAGTYRIDLSTEHVITLRGMTSHAAGIAMTFPEQRSKPVTVGKVVFQRYGDHYYIREVWVAGSNEGRKCVMSHEEKREKQLLVAKNSVPSNVEIAMNTGR